MIKTLLIANRGEIACRIIASAKTLGITTIAVFSEADLFASHVLKADQAFSIGPAPASLSYLDYPKIIDIAQRANADAIHPGYGFLSENAEFARACSKANLIFVGPTPEAIEAMGSKILAKTLMTQASVSVLPDKPHLGY